MKSIAWIVLVVSILLLSGCSNLPEKHNLLKININNKDYLLETAKNQEQKEIGLSYRKNLPRDRGMIFYFDQPEILSFWMKNTLIPLQIVFINGCEIVDIQEMTVEPNTEQPTKAYKSNTLADKAIELNPNSIPSNMIRQRIDDLCR